MRKFLFSLIAVATAMQMSAAPVDQYAALGKAQEFLKNNGGKVMASTASSLKLHRAVMGDVKVNQPVFYVFNSSNSFIIVSGDDRAEEILGYGEGTLDMDKIPANMREWFNGYKRQIEYLQAHPGLVVKVSSKLNAPKRAKNVSPLLSARWDQQAPFWNQCVINGTQCLTGCPATSLAQVFYYWKYPLTETGVVPSYTFSGITVPALPSTTFDWGNMRDSYLWNGGTAAQKAAVATLMRYIGQAEHMEYGANGSGISSSRTDLISNACKFFGYDSNVRAIYKQSYWGSNLYSDAQWASLIQAELEAGHPIVYCGLSDNGGHAFNVDGYTVATDKYHINWGWSGSGNGDFALNAFTDYEGDTYNQYQSMVIGIQPPGGQITLPVLNLDVESIDFGTVSTGQTVTQTINVSGENILGDVTFSRSGSSYYSVSPATLTAEQVKAGATVTVTYAPTAAGTHTGSINVATSGAESLVITLTGTAQNVPVIFSDKSEVELTADGVGQSVTGTFTVTGKNLTNTLYFSMVEGGDQFKVNKTNVTKTAAAKGVEVTVTYKPTTVGAHTGTVMMRSAGADTVYVTFKGTCNFTKSTPVMQPADAQYVTQTSFLAAWTDATAASGVSSYTLEYATEGDTRTVTGITARNYLLEDLIAGATYSYKVMALYTDGTQSDWSNTQQVTLLQAPAYEMGDVNHDGTVNITDATNLIDYLLSGAGDIYPENADLTMDGSVDISDITALIDLLLSGN